MNFLKIEGRNLINFDFAGQNFNEIQIIQQYSKFIKGEGEEAVFEVVYSLKMDELTLRELLLCSSMYYTSSINEVSKLVALQPSPTIFFKSLFEFNGSNLVSILAFDSHSIKSLLEDKNSSHFQSEFPIFYKNQLRKRNNQSSFYYRSAIGIALKNN